MQSQVRRFDSGWIGLSLALSPSEVETLIDLLGQLKRGELGHFHARNDVWTGAPGVADIEFSMTHDDGGGHDLALDGSQSITSNG